MRTLKRIRNFFLKWILIFLVIIGAVAWFVHSNWLNQYGWVVQGKDYTMQQSAYYAQSAKNSLIHKLLDSVGYTDSNNGVNNTNNSVNTTNQGNTTPGKNTGNSANTNTENVPPQGATNIPMPGSSVAIVSQFDFPRLSIPFFYDHSDAPQNLSKEQVLSLVSKASAAWTSACNVSFDYKGDRLSDYVDVNNTINRKEGLVKWGSLPGDAIGQAHQGTGQGPATGFVLTLKPEYFAHTENDKYLYSTILHEMGHVIGLGHSKNPSSIMFWQQSNRKQVLNETDRAMCAYFRGRWQGLSVQQAQDKYGVLVNESTTPDEEVENSQNDE